MVPLIPLFWTSGDVSSGFQATVGRFHWYPCLGVLMTSPLGFKPEWAGICDVHCPRFTSGATPVDLSMVSMAAGRSFPHAIHYRWIKFSTDTPSHYFNPFHDLGTLFMGGGGFSLFITRMTIQELYYWWLVNVTLVVAFDFFTKIFQRWWDLWMLFCRSVTVGWVVRILKPYLL